MKQIKFRAWDKVNKVWAYMTIQNGQFETHIEWEFSIAELEPWQEFTGLLDKNGKEIYEGDIVKMYINGTFPIPQEIITSISFHEGTYTVLKLNEEPLSLRDAIVVSNKTKQGLEIIGNIYEHPDLLSTKE